MRQSSSQLPAGSMSWLLNVAVDCKKHGPQKRNIKHIAGNERTVKIVRVTVRLKTPVSDALKRCKLELVASAHCNAERLLIQH